jgi:hypothetical protein
VSVPSPPPAAERPALRVGQRVRSTNDAPVFSSDPKAGDQGIVSDVRGTNTHGIDTTSYLVRWSSGLESWVPADTVEPMRIGDALPVSAPVPATIRGAGPAPSPIARLGARGSIHAKRLLGIGALLLGMVSFAPGAIHFLRHPSMSGQAWFAAIPLFIIANALWVARRRPPAPKRPDGNPPAAP